MKKLLSFLLLVLLFTSCIPLQKFTTNTSFVDFREYTEKGFYISMYKEAPYNYEYIGYIEVAVVSGEDKNMKPPSKKTSLMGPNYGKYRIATAEDAIEALYKQAIKAGADGIIDLKFASSTTFSTYATGVAIKKK